MGPIEKESHIVDKKFPEVEPGTRKNRANFLTPSPVQPYRVVKRGMVAIRSRYRDGLVAVPG